MQKRKVASLWWTPVTDLGSHGHRDRQGWERVSLPLAWWPRLPGCMSPWGRSNRQIRSLPTPRLVGTPRSAVGQYAWTRTASTTTALIPVVAGAGQSLALTPTTARPALIQSRDITRPWHHAAVRRSSSGDTSRISIANLCSRSSNPQHRFSSLFGAARRWALIQRVWAVGVPVVMEAYTRCQVLDRGPVTRVMMRVL